MKVGMYYSNKDIRVQEMTTPQIGNGELLIKVIASGICGSDTLEWYRADKVPLILGHEISGEVVEVGCGVLKFQKGDRICAAHHVPCGSCHYCISGHHTVCDTLRITNFDPGGFVEYLRLPAINVERGTFLLPGDISFEEATFVEPLACVWRAQRAIGDLTGKTVMVIGCGIAGLLHIILAKSKGAGIIIATDINQFRLKSAKKHGADYTISADEYDAVESLKKFNSGRLADVIILCTGALSAVNQAISSIDRGGTLLFFAVTDKGVRLSIDPNKLFWRSEITLTSSYAGTQEDYAKALELISLKKIKVADLITHYYSLDDINTAFKTVTQAKDSLKVIIKPHN